MPTLTSVIKSQFQLSQGCKFLSNRCDQRTIPGKK